MKNIILSEIIDYNDLQTKLSAPKISKKRVRERVTCQLGLNSKKAFRFRPATAIPVFAVILLLTATIVAYGFSSGFRELLFENFGIVFVQTQEIGQSVSDNGVEMTVRGAARDASSVLLLVEFKKLDGTEFDTTADIRNLNLKTNDNSVVGPLVYSRQRFMSKDQKTLTYLINSQIESIEDSLTFDVLSDGLYLNKERKEENLDIDLNAIYVDQKDGLDKKMLTEDGRVFFEPLGLEYTLTGITFCDGAIVVEVNMPQSSYSVMDDSKSFELSYLLNKKTGKKYVVSSVENYPSPESNPEKNLKKKYFFDGVGVEDLGDLALFYSYNSAEELDGKWNAKVKMDKNNSNIVLRDIQNEILIGNSNLEMAELHCSLVGLTIEGTVEAISSDQEQVQHDFIELEPAFLLKNKETIPLVFRGTEVWDNNKLVAFYGANQPVQTDQIEAICLGKTTISVE